MIDTTDEMKDKTSTYVWPFSTHGTPVIVSGLRLELPPKVAADLERLYRSFHVEGLEDMDINYERLATGITEIPFSYAKWIYDNREQILDATVSAVIGSILSGTSLPQLNEDYRLFKPISMPPDDMNVNFGWMENVTIDGVKLLSYPSFEACDFDLHDHRYWRARGGFVYEQKPEQNGDEECREMLGRILNANPETRFGVLFQVGPRVPYEDGKTYDTDVRLVVHKITEHGRRQSEDSEYVAPESRPVSAPYAVT